MSVDIQLGDCLDLLKQLPDNSVDLVLCSPPYEDARTYGIGFRLKGQDWVDWSVERYLECVRVCRGLVVWVVEGKTKDFRWTATPALLMADLHRKGVRLRKPPVFHRVGIAGSGGPDWWRNDYEFCVCSSKGKLPWSDNTANGHPPKWAPVGEMSNRVTDGTRRNQWRHSGTGKRGARTKDGERTSAERPSHVKKTMREMADEPKTQAFIAGEMPPGSKLHTKRNAHETRVQCYTPPKLANAGNVIHCVVGGGVMGSRLCHENEAPFPEKLVEPFIKCFCPPGGVVLDPFCGSGTTLAVADRLGRNAIGFDVRASQVELSGRRVQENGQ